MKRFWLYPLVTAMMSVAAPGFAQTAQPVQVAQQASVDVNSPDAMIQTVTNRVLSTIKADKSIKSGDINRITQVVNAEILPYTDFRRTTRTATPQQQDQLVEQFKMLLIRTYSGALSQVKDQTVQFKPFRADPGATDVVVRSAVINNGQPVELDYRLYKTPQGWRVYDLNVAGAWLIQAYQQQFNEKINEGGVAALVQFLTQRNEQLAAGKQPS